MTPDDYLAIFSVALPLVTMAIITAAIVWKMKQKGEG